MSITSEKKSAPTQRSARSVSTVFIASGNGDAGDAGVQGAGEQVELAAAYGIERREEKRFALFLHHLFGAYTVGRKVVDGHSSVGGGG